MGASICCERSAIGVGGGWVRECSYGRDPATVEAIPDPPACCHRFRWHLLRRETRSPITAVREYRSHAARATPLRRARRALDLIELRSATATRHPWEVARAQAVEAILARRQLRIATLLDYGCGDGYTGERIQEAFRVPQLTAVDTNMPAVWCGVARGEVGTVERSRDPNVLRGRRFDLILLCDVIEHVEDDVGMLGRLRRDHLAPDGLVMVTVPAFQALFSAHDRFLKHHRRYTLSGLRDVVAGAGLAPVDDGYLFGSLLPARVVTAAVGERAADAPDAHGIGGWQGGPALTRLVTTALQVDNAIMLAGRRLGLTLPGLTAWALCRTS